MAISSDLERLLVRWLPRQRWMPVLGDAVGESPDVTPLSVVRIAEVADDDTGAVQCLLVVLAARGNSRGARVCVPLTLRTREDYALRSDLIGSVDDLLLGRSFVYDGAADPVFILALADHIADARAATGDQIASHLSGDELPGDNGNETPVPERRSLAQQRHGEEYGQGLLSRSRAHRFRRTDSMGSESRIEIAGPDGEYALILLRTIGAENPPAVRYPLALTAVESATVHPVIGWSQTTWFDDISLQEVTAPFAVLAHAKPGSQRSWRAAVETAIRVDSGAVGSFNRQASVLGTAVGALHVDLASEFGLVRSEGGPTKQLVAKWQERIDWALNRAPGALRPFEGQLWAHSNALAELESIGPLQRIHGELTLDHITVGAEEGPRVIGFSTSVDEPRPAEIDLVAMLRSVDYAAGYAWLRRTGVLDGDDAHIRALATVGLADEGLRDDYLTAPEHLWYRQTVNSLLSGYSHARGTTTALIDPVLRGALIDRLLVEVVTELRSRPAWLIVPLAALASMLGMDDAGDAAAQDAEEELPADSVDTTEAVSLLQSEGGDPESEQQAVASADILPGGVSVEDAGSASGSEESIGAGGDVGDSLPEAQKSAEGEAVPRESPDPATDVADSVLPEVEPVEQDDDLGRDEDTPSEPEPEPEPEPAEAADEEAELEEAPDVDADLDEDGAGVEEAGVMPRSARNTRSSSD